MDKFDVRLVEVIAQEYTITASAGEHGSISPSGEVTVTEGENQTFAITPDAGYKVKDVKVDGVSVGAVTEYTFENVSADASIEAEFALEKYTEDNRFQFRQKWEHQQHLKQNSHLRSSMMRAMTMDGPA